MHYKEDSKDLGNENLDNDSLITVDEFTNHTEAWYLYIYST